MALALVAHDFVIHAGGAVGAGGGELALAELSFALGSGEAPGTFAPQGIKVSHAGPAVLAHICRAHVPAAGVSSISIGTDTSKSSNRLGTVASILAAKSTTIHTEWYTVGVLLEG